MYSVVCRFYYAAAPEVYDLNDFQVCFPLVLCCLFITVEYLVEYRQDLGGLRGREGNQKLKWMTLQYCSRKLSRIWQHGNQGNRIVVCIVSLLYFTIFSSCTFTPFSPQFCEIQLVVSVLSHRCKSLTDSGEAKVESHASSETQPNQAALLYLTQCSLNLEAGRTMCRMNHRTPGDHISVHCARPATGIAIAWWDKDIPAGQTLP